MQKYLRWPYMTNYAFSIKISLGFNSVPHQYKQNSSETKIIICSTKEYMSAFKIQKWRFHIILPLFWKWKSVWERWRDSKLWIAILIAQWDIWKYSTTIIWENLFITFFYSFKVWLDNHINPLSLKALISRLRKFEQVLKSFFSFRNFNKVKQFIQLIL